MKVRQIALVGSSIVVLGALVLLMMEVKATPDTEISAEELAAAQAQYEESKTGIRNAPQPRPAPPMPMRPPPSREPVGFEGAGPGELEREPKRIQVSPRAASELQPPPERSPDLAAEAPLDPKQAKVDEIRGYYDQGDHMAALEASRQFLRETPDDPYVLRVAVVSACASGDETFAREQFGRMNARDQRVTRIRCQRFGIEL